MDGGNAELLASLTDLFEQSRSADGRAALAGAGLPRALALLVPSVLDACLRERSEAAVDQLVGLLRTLRNACAGAVDSKEQLRDAHCAEHLAQLLCVLAREPTLERRSLLMATALQVLGNSCVQHTWNQDATWCGTLYSGCAAAALLTLQTGPGRLAFQPRLRRQHLQRVRSQLQPAVDERAPEKQVAAQQALMCTQLSAWSCTCAVGSNLSDFLRCVVVRGRSLSLTCCLRAKRRCARRSTSHRAQVQLSGCSFCLVKCAHAGSGSCCFTPRLATSPQALRVAVFQAHVRRFFCMLLQAPLKFVKTHRGRPMSNQRCAFFMSRLGRSLKPASSVLWAPAARACVFVAYNPR